MFIIWWVSAVICSFCLTLWGKLHSSLSQNIYGAFQKALQIHFHKKKKYIFEWEFARQRIAAAFSLIATYTSWASISPEVTIISITIVMIKITSGQHMCTLILCRKKQTPQTHVTRNFAALFSSCEYPPFSLKGKWGDTRHPSLWKEQVCEKHSFASQWQSLGDGVGGWVGGWGGTAQTHSWGGELHQASPDKIFLRGAHSFEPNLLYMWCYWQGHKYLWVMSCCSPETDGVLPLCSVWGQIALDNVTRSR